MRSLWTWLTVGGGAALVWLFWERIMKFAEGWLRIKKAYHEERIALHQERASYHESKISELKEEEISREHRIQAMVRKLESGLPADNRPVDFSSPPKAAPGEDPEELKEAYRRFLDKHRKI